LIVYTITNCKCINMEPEETILHRIDKQIRSFIDREMSFTLVFWIAVFLIAAVMKLFGFID
jgi:hypothetical protein